MDNEMETRVFEGFIGIRVSQNEDDNILCAISGSPILVNYQIPPQYPLPQLFPYGIIFSLRMIKTSSQEREISITKLLMALPSYMGPQFEAYEL